GKNSEALRPLGLGYANLGALLMSMGLAYDSDEGRRFAGGITAIMTGRAFAQSARMAQVKGPFSEYAKNREPMLRVMEKHRQEAHQLSTSRESADAGATAEPLARTRGRGRRRSRDMGRGGQARPSPWLSQRPGHGPRADRNDR